MQLARKAVTLCEITRHEGQLEVAQDTDFGINWKPVCDFLLVNNTNLFPVCQL